MSIKFFKDLEGNIIGAFVDGAVPPEDAIEINIPKSGEIWDGVDWKKEVIVVEAPASTRFLSRAQIASKLVDYTIIDQEEAIRLVSQGFVNNKTDFDTSLELIVQWQTATSIDLDSFLFASLITYYNLDFTTLRELLGAES